MTVKDFQPFTFNFSLSSCRKNLNSTKIWQYVAVVKQKNRSSSMIHRSICGNGLHINKTEFDNYQNYAIETMFKWNALII